MRTGRPSSYTEEVAAVLLERIALGEGLKAITRDDAMPGMSTVLRWLHDNADFRGRYAAAREVQADRLFDEADDVARDALAGIVDPQAARLFIDTVKWRAGKMRPKVYGDKLEIDQTINLRTQSLADMMDAIDARMVNVTPKPPAIAEG